MKLVSRLAICIPQQVQQVSVCFTPRHEYGWGDRRSWTLNIEMEILCFSIYTPATCSNVSPSLMLVINWIYEPFHIIWLCKAQFIDPTSFSVGVGINRPLFYGLDLPPDRLLPLCALKKEAAFICIMVFRKWAGANWRVIIHQLQNRKIRIYNRNHKNICMWRNIRRTWHHNNMREFYWV